MQGSARKDVVFGAARVYTFTVPGPKWKSWFNYINRVADGLGVDPEQCMGEGHRAGAQRWKFPADPSAWFQKFAYLKSPLPKHRTDRPSGPEVVCSQSLLSRDREGAVQGLAAYRRSRTYGTKH